MGYDMVYHRAQRGQTNATGHYHYVFPFRQFDGPGTAERPAHTKHIARLEFAHRPRNRANGTSRMYQGIDLGRIATDGDGNLAYPVHVEHIKLTAGKGGDRTAIARFQLHGERIWYLGMHAQDAI